MSVYCPVGKVPSVSSYSDHHPMRGSYDSCPKLTAVVIMKIVFICFCNEYIYNRHKSRIQVMVCVCSAFLLSLNSNLSHEMWKNPVENQTNWRFLLFQSPCAKTNVNACRTGGGSKCACGKWNCMRNKAQQQIIRPWDSNLPIRSLSFSFPISPVCCFLWHIPHILAPSTVALSNCHTQLF